MVLGVQYERMPNPRVEDWDGDLALLSEMGFTVVRTWMYWSKVNPSDGTWVFTHYDRLFRLAEKHGLKVQIQLFCEAPPGYLRRLHPEWAYRNERGEAERYIRRPAQQVGGFQGFDYSHPEARAAAVDYIARVCGRYRDDPALYGYDVWNEVWMSQWLDGEYSRKERIGYLRTKCGDLAALNAAWQEDFAEWDQVDDPRISAPLGLKLPSEGHHVDNIDVIESENHARSRNMEWRARAVRGADPGHPVMGHVGSMAGRWETGIDSWDLASHVDVWGVSGHFDNLDDYAVACHVCSEVAAGRPWWLAESGSGRLGLGFHGKQKSPDFLQSVHTLVMMYGGTGEIYWQFRPEIFGPESPNFGLVGLGGEPTVRSRRTAEIAAVHRNHADYLDDTTFAEPRVGLLCSPSNTIFSNVHDSKVWGKYRADLWANWIGWRLALCHAGLDPALFRDVDVAAAGVPDTVKVLFAPLQIVELPDLSSELVKWVKGGGTLVAGPWFGMYDERLFVKRHVPDTDLFGVKEVEFDSRPEAVLEFVGKLSMLGSLPAGDVIEDLEPAGAEALAVFGGNVAITAHNVGNGRALYVGCLPGTVYDCRRSPQLESFALSLCASAGIVPAVSVTGGCCCRVGEGRRGPVLYLVNPHASSAAAWVDWPASVNGRLADLYTGETFDVVNGSFRVPMPAQGSRVLVSAGTDRA